MASALFRDILFSCGLLLVFAGLAWIARFALNTYGHRLTQRTETDMDDLVLNVLRGPVVMGVLLLGMYLAVIRLPIVPGGKVDRIFMAMSSLIGVYVVWRLVNALLNRYATAIAAQAGGEVGTQFLLIRKIINIAILIVGLILILDQLGYQLTPIVTSLGIAGLAVALALQDTLANFFSGLYLMIDKPIKVGDYIKLDSGEEGFIDTIGWRSTHIRLWSNNIVVIPNSKLSQSVITNYSIPDAQVKVYVSGGVSYDSDLDEVERITLEVARETMGRVPGASKSWNPVMRYKEFADSNINFIVVLMAESVTAQYLLSHEFMKALFRRYKQEGIEISFPMRNVILTRITNQSAAGQGVPEEVLRR